MRRGEQNVIFALFPGCEVLDLAGPLQVFHEANHCGARYTITIAAESPQMETAQKLMLSDSAPLPLAQAGDLIIVPGYDMRPAPPPAHDCVLAGCVRLCADASGVDAARERDGHCAQRRAGTPARRSNRICSQRGWLCAGSQRRQRIHL